MLKAYLKEFLKSFSILRITLIFIISYLLINSIYSIYFANYLLSPIALFITSPFNALENYSSMYHSFSEGYYSNLGLVALSICCAELYSRFLLKKYKRYLSIDSAFCFAILASYATAVIYWIASGIPSIGTSIIGFSMVLFLLGNSVSDIKFYSNKQYLQDRKHVIVLVPWVALIIVSMIFSASYIIENPSYIAHIIGALIFGTFIVTYYYLKRKKIHELHWTV